VCEISPRSFAPRASAARSGWRAPPQSASSLSGCRGRDTRAEQRRRTRAEGEGNRGSLLARDGCEMRAGGRRQGGKGRVGLVGRIGRLRSQNGRTDG
jgi:hypothetical protein